MLDFFFFKSDVRTMSWFPSKLQRTIFEFTDLNLFAMFPSVASFILIDAQIIPSLTSGSPFKLVPEFL